MKRFFACLLVLVLLPALLISALGAENHDAHIGGIDNDTWFTKYGNVNTDCEAAYFLGELGYDWGDLVTVRFLEQELVLPVVPDYSYVESGESAVIVRRDDNGQPERTVSLAVNMGNFAETYGLAVKVTDQEGNWHWEPCEGITFPITVSFSLQEKEGYLAQYLLHELSRTNAREDYAHLSDREFANFRELLPGKLYRSSSPINPELGRNLFADDALEAAGVTVIMNLADSPEEAQSYPDFQRLVLLSDYFGLSLDALVKDIDVQDVRQKNQSEQQIGAIYDDIQKAKWAVNTVINGFAIFGIVGIAILLLIPLIWG